MTLMILDKKQAQATPISEIDKFDVVLVMDEKEREYTAIKNRVGLCGRRVLKNHVQAFLEYLKEPSPSG